MWEFTSGVPPLDDEKHDHQLIVSICEGERSEILKNTRNDDPLKRPTASELSEIFTNWMHGLEGFLSDEKLGNDIMEFDKADQVSPTKISNKSNPEAYHTSRRYAPITDGESLKIPV